MVTEFHGKGVVRGIVTADLVLIPHSFSFLGDVEMNHGTILVGENQGVSLKDKILVFTESKGSSGGCVVLLTLVKKQLAPKGIVTVKMPDYNLAEGAILSNILFLANISPDIFHTFHTGDQAKLDSNAETISLLNTLSE